MIDIQIVEEERQVGQPIIFKLIIACSSRPIRTFHELAPDAQDFDFICIIRARSTASKDDLDSPFDSVLTNLGYDEPCPRIPLWQGQLACLAGQPHAAPLPLAVLDTSRC